MAAKKLKPAIHVRLYKGELFRRDALHKEFQVRGFVRQLSNDHYIGPAFMLDSYPGKKYRDGTEVREQWIFQGCKMLVMPGGHFLVEGFTTEEHHHAEEGHEHFYRSELSFDAEGWG